MEGEGVKGGRSSSMVKPSSGVLHSAFLPQGRQSAQAGVSVILGCEAVKQHTSSLINNNLISLV